MLTVPPFSLNSVDKKELFNKEIATLSNHHYNNCISYRKIADALNEKSPLIPARLFKLIDLYSVPKENIIKTLYSSATTNQLPSKIFLDKQTAQIQTKVLAKILSDFMGAERLPMLVIDSPTVLNNRQLFSARGAAILGFSIIGRNITYALDEDMNINYDCITEFFNKYKNNKILFFGFTYIVWEYFYKQILASKFVLPEIEGVLIHGGGWKKLEREAVSNDILKSKIRETIGIDRVYNYYGMIEQTGSIFMECEHGRLHTSIFSDVDVVNPYDFNTMPIGAEGVLKLTSLLPYSYPGHIILSEDLGQIMGEDDCPCGRLGKTFKVLGRIKNAEIRGCSDAHEGN
jgi:hypothetical protein